MKTAGEAIIALIGFQGGSQKIGGSRWKSIGRVGAYQIEYRRLYKSEAAFAELPLAKQQQLARRYLKQAEKHGAVWVGVPWAWRPVFAGQSRLEIVDPRGLLLRQALQRLDEDLGGLQGRQIAVVGVEDKLASRAVALLLAQGAYPVLCGRRAAELADYYYQKEGVALPVATGSRLLAACAGRLELCANHRPLRREHTVGLTEEWLEVQGDFGTPFEQGRFPGGLAAALTKGGAGLQTKNPSVSLDKQGDLAV